MPRRTPSAVNGDGSPEPPCDDIDAGHVLRLRSDHFHVFEPGARVFRRDVPPAQIRNELPERPEVRNAVETAFRQHQYALSAPVLEPRDRGLVAHTARQPQRVGERARFVCVANEPATAKSRTQPRIMDGHDRSKPRWSVAANVNLTVFMGSHRRKQVHAHSLLANPLPSAEGLGITALSRLSGRTMLSTRPRHSTRTARRAACQRARNIRSANSRGQACARSETARFFVSSSRRITTAVDLLRRVRSPSRGVESS